MNRNTIQSFGILLLLIACFCSCGGNESDVLSPDETATLVSSVPEIGATVDPSMVNIVLNFNKDILFVNRNNITLNDRIVSQPTFSGHVLTIPVSSLEENTDYVLRITASTVRIEPGVFNKESFTVTFKTSNYPEAEISTDLVVKNPSAEAKNVYQYLHDTYKSKIISGMMANVSWNNTESERVFQLTGKYPAINCYDYIHLPWSPANWIDYGDITPVKAWWNAGGMVAAGWHWTVPTSEVITDPSKMTYKPEETTFRAKNATVAGTWENKVVKADLGKMATYLKLLKAEGIPVLWRPLHEASGNIYEYSGGTAWFWWGYDGADAFKKLWIYMFDYFQSEGLNNLVWVWTTQTKDEAFYPGDTYVDIVGRDLYDQNTASCVAQYETITKKYSHKIVTLSECGTVGIISEQWNAGTRWSWFMPWYDNSGATSTHATDNWWKDAMKQTYVVTRDQLPSFR